MYIFRIQNDDGVGCMWGQQTYRLPEELKYDYSSYIFDKNGIRIERHQHPDVDVGTPLAAAYSAKLIYRGGPLLFGFETIKDLYTWFCPATIGCFELNGYYIHVYDIPEEHVIRGTNQVAFNPIYSTHNIKISHKKLRCGFRTSRV